ncbi:MAG: hypothetical protein ACPGJU_07895 [Coraliomargarita sp.]
MEWIFRRKLPQEKTRDPIQGEFFNTTVVDDSCSSLVREGIQNALDARRSDCDKVEVRITLSGNDHALTPEVAQRWFGALYPHIQSEDIGLPSPPQPSEPCPYILFEDFHTTGLYGDIHQHSAEPGIENPFFYFFRAEGKSIKQGRKRGRWGLGKYVFPGSSRGRALICLTLPKDSNQLLLMGQAVLRYHKLDGVHYSPDANWAVQNPDGADLPNMDSEWINTFKNDFGITRTNETGLSIAIPWYDAEAVTCPAMIRAVIKDYFWPIIHEQLVVSIKNGNEEIVINSETITQMIDRDDNSLDHHLIELAKWAKEQNSDSIPLNSVYPEADTWSESTFPPDEIENLCARFISGEKLCFNVPITIQPKNGPELQSSFRVYLWKGGGDHNSKPTFIRNGIIIRDAGSRNIRGVSCLVVVDDGHCATMLGDAENPAHTQWNHNTPSLKNNYKYPYWHLRAVTDSASKIFFHLSGATQQENRSLLLDFFGLEESEYQIQSDAPPKKKKRKGTETTDPDPEIPPAKPKRYQLRKRNGGFTIIKGDDEAPLPKRIEIRMAYDIRSGSAAKALKSYDKNDFAIGSNDFQVQTRNMSIAERKENRIITEIDDADFALDVDGFDLNRDLVVAVKVDESETDEGTES